MHTRELTRTEVALALSKVKNPNNLNLAKSLLSGTELLPDTDCWTLDTDWSKYVTFRGEIAHILSYKLFVGQVIKFILHKCDRKGCINPDHLFQGSQAANVRDWRRKRAMHKFARAAMARGNKIEDRRFTSRIRSWQDDYLLVQSLIDQEILKDTFLDVKERTKKC